MREFALMRELIINIEINGKKVRVGSIIGDRPEEAFFLYDSKYIHMKDAQPVSISLPLQDEPFSPERTKNYFEGLLPEGFTRKTVAQWMHADEEDYLSILSGLGRECLGALQVTEKGQSIEERGYRVLTDDQVLALAREGTTVSSTMVVEAHLSLTGASGKVGLYYDDHEKRWFLPKGDAPSTHILKQSHVRLLDIVANEQLCMLTAELLGLDVPESFIVDPGDISKEEVLFATRRFDRIFTETSEEVTGKRIPLRLHQEDFAQALGIPASKKYENQKSGYLKQIFDLIRHCSANPLEDQLRLWDILVFDCLIGNTDNHLKNLSFLYSQDMKSIRLAPAYDIVSTVVYDGATRNLSFFIGNDNSLDRIQEDSFRLAAKEAGMNERLCIRRLRDMEKRFRPALDKAAEKMISEGIPGISDLKEKILLKGYKRNGAD